MKELTIEEQIKVLFISPRELFLKYYIIKYGIIAKKARRLTS